MMQRFLYRAGLLAAVLLAGVLAVPAWAQVESLPGSGAPVRFLPADEVERHLPQSSVYAIVEDQQGFLWFATREGVGRWDGYEMRTWKYDPFDDASLPGNVVRELVQDRYGNLWLMAQNYLEAMVGVARIVAPAFETVQRYGFAGALPFLDETGHPMLASLDSLYRYDPVADQFVAMMARARPGTYVVVAMTAGSGKILLGLGNGLFEMCNRTRGTCREVSWDESWQGRFNAATSVGIFEDDRGTVWVGTGRGLAQLRGDRARLERCVTAPPHLDDHYIADIEQDAEGFLWMLTSDGVYRFDPDARHFEHFPLATLGEDTQNLAPITLHIDQAGTIWVGTVWGLYRYNPHRKPFSHLQHDPQNPNSLSAGLVVSLLEEADGSLWVGTIGGGLNRVNRRTGEVTRYRHDPADPYSLSHDLVWALAKGQDGSVWAGTGFGLNQYDPALDGFLLHLVDPTQEKQKNLGVPDLNVVVGLVVDREGRFWMNTSNTRLARFDPIQATFRLTALPASLDAGYMMIDADNMLWFGTSRGIYQMNLHTEEITPFAGQPAGTDYDGILAFYRDRKGTFWVGANSGLYRFEPDSSPATRYSDVDGLPSSVVYGLLEDDAGRLWLSTNRGLASFDPTQPPGRQFRTYDHTNGIQNVEFNRNAYLRARDGTLFFGGDKGVTFFDPAAIHDNPYRPPIVLTALHKSTRQGRTTTRYFGDGPVEIMPNEYTFTFTFAALNFSNAHHNRYAVMMEGWDADWLPQGTQRQATYTNLPPGPYTFRVKASNDDGLWNEEGIAVPVVVHPRFWQTGWFRVLAVFSILAAVGAVVWSFSRRRYRRQLQRLQAQQALERERNRISRDMHDEVGASLTEIAILSELAQRQSGNGLGAQPQLEKIASTSRAMLDAIGEIIWAINPQNDRLDRVVAYLRQYAAAYLENTPVRLQLRFPQRVPEGMVSAEFRRNVFLVLKEALHNLVKHAQAGEVWVELTLDGDHLALRVEDDGCGFDGEAGRPGGNGLRNMKHRAEEIGGRLAVDSVPEQGTRVHLTVPLAEEGRPSSRGYFQ